MGKVNLNPLLADGDDVYYYLGDMLSLWLSLLIHHPSGLGEADVHGELFGVLSKSSIDLLILGSENLITVFSIINNYILTLPSPCIFVMLCRVANFYLELFCFALFRAIEFIANLAASNMALCLQALGPAYFEDIFVFKSHRHIERYLCHHYWPHFTRDGTISCCSSISS